MEIKEIKDVNNVITGFELDHLEYYLKPIDEGQTINLSTKSEIFLTIDDKDTTISLSDIFVEITSISGNIIYGWSMLQLMEEDHTVKINKGLKDELSFKIGLYDKITGVHCKIVAIDWKFFRGRDKKVTTEDMIKYCSILQTGKVTKANEVTETGPTVEEKLALAIKEKEELEAKIQEEKRLAEEKIQADIKAKEEAEEKAKREADEKAEIEAKLKKSEEEAKQREKEEAEAKAAAAEQKRKDTVAKQLGGQDYLDLIAELKPKGYHEYSYKSYRFFFKDEDEIIILIKLHIGGFIDLEDAIDDGYIETENEELLYELNEDGEKKDVIFNPKSGTVEIKKSKAKVE